MLNLLELLMKKFYINVNQIVANSDNNIDEVKNEGYIVLSEHYDKILKDNRVFINELKKRCLKFNKYGRRIESKEMWEKFNSLEDRMNNVSPLYSTLDEDTLYDLLDVKSFLSDTEYKFLIYYYNYGCEITSRRYDLSPEATRQRVHTLISKLKKHFNRRG